MFLTLGQLRAASKDLPDEAEVHLSCSITPTDELALYGAEVADGKLFLKLAVSPAGDDWDDEDDELTDKPVWLEAIGPAPMPAKELWAAARAEILITGHTVEASPFRPSDDDCSLLEMDDHELEGAGTIKCVAYVDASLAELVYSNGDTPTEIDAAGMVLARLTPYWD